MVCAPHRFTIIGMAKGLTNTGYQTNNSITLGYKQDLSTIISQPIRSIYESNDFVKEKYDNKNTTTYTLPIYKQTPSFLQTKIFQTPTIEQLLLEKKEKIQTYTQTKIQEDYSMKQTENKKSLKKEKQELAKKVLSELEKIGVEIPSLHTHKDGTTHHH